MTFPYLVHLVDGPERFDCQNEVVDTELEIKIKHYSTAKLDLRRFFSWSVTPQILQGKGGCTQNCCQ